eukprot:scaffold1992_cov187-Amphora_coffeaeformis.AAC.6
MMFTTRLYLLCLLLASKVSRTTPRKPEKKQQAKLIRNDHLKDFRSAFSDTMAPSMVSPTPSPSATPAAAPTAPPATQYFEECFLDLVTADVDGGGAIERDEFLEFINVRGQRLCWQQTDLSLRQVSIYNRLACLCRENDNSDATCCLGDNAKLPLTNALQPDERTAAQFEFLALVCQDTDMTIPDNCSRRAMTVRRRFFERPESRQELMVDDHVGVATDWGSKMGVLL